MSSRRPTRTILFVSGGLLTAGLLRWPFAQFASFDISYSSTFFIGALLGAGLYGSARLTGLAGSVWFLPVSAACAVGLWLSGHVGGAELARERLARGLERESAALAARPSWEDRTAPWKGWAGDELEAYLRWRLDDRTARLGAWGLLRVRAAEGAQHYRRGRYGTPAFTRQGGYAWLAWALQLPLLMLGVIVAALLDTFRGGNAVVARRLSDLLPDEELQKRPDHAAERAAFRGDLDLLGKALEKGASVKPRGSFAHLHAGARAGRTAVLSFLLEKGAGLEDRDGRGLTPLQAAATDGGDEALGFLLDRGADIEATDGAGFTALDHAARKGRLSTMGLLLDRGASLGPRPGGGSALSAAASAGQTGAIDLLLHRGAAVDAADDEGVTALIVAARKNQPDGVKRLIEKGARADHRDRRYINAFVWASLHNGVEAMEALLAAGFRPDEQDLVVMRDDLEARERPQRADEIHALLKRI